MDSLKVLRIALCGAGLGFAYIGKAAAVSNGTSTATADQAIKMGQERLQAALKS